MMASYNEIVKDLPEPKRSQFLSCMQGKTDDGWDPGKKKNIRRNLMSRAVPYVLLLFPLFPLHLHSRILSS